MFGLRLGQLRCAFAYFLLQDLVLILQLEMKKARLQQVADAQHDFDRIQGFGQEVCRPAGQRATLGLGRRIRGEHQDREVSIRRNERSQSFHDGKPVQVRHHQIKQNQIRLIFCIQLQGLTRISQALEMVVAIKFQNAFQ